jgi:TRAP-type transport system periplasmic protein
MDGAVGKELAEKTAEKGMVVLGYWDNGIRHMSNSKRPLLKPEDLKGLKMRTPPDSVTVDIMQSLGAEAQQIKFSELYVALQQGVVDGQENPLTNIASAKLYEVQKYISLTGHKYEMTPFLMSKRTWDRLSDAERKAVQEAANEATALQRKLSKESDDKLVAELKAKGVQVDAVDKGAFQKATASVVTKWEASPIGPFVKKVVAASRAN